MSDVAAIADPLAPNSEDAHGWYWDPWKVMNIDCGGYSSAVDGQAIDVLKAIRGGVAVTGQDGLWRYATAIAKATGLAEEHVELWQYIFCSAGWCDYGTSPRGCFIAHDFGPDFGDRLIAAWEAYYLRQWQESHA